MTAEERQLSDRERTVLLLAAEGLTDKEIAKHLDLSQRTIGTYWERMRQKLGPYSRTQLVARFLRVEADAERADESYRTLFSTWEEGVWILSPDGESIFANESLAALIGVDLKEVVNADPAEFLREVAQLDFAELASGAEGSPIAKEFCLPSSELGKRWLSLRSFPVADRRGRRSAMVLLVQDVTLQKRINHTLASCNSVLDFVAEQCSDAIGRFSSDLTCVYANGRLVELLGVDPRGKEISQCGLDPIDQWVNNVQECLRDGERRQFASVWKGKELVTFVVAEPSLEFLPSQVLTLTQVQSST